MNNPDDTGAVQVSGDYLLSASREVVWDKLRDPDVLAYCIRGCETVTRDSKGEYQAEFRVGFGPLKGKLRGRLWITEVDPPHQYQLDAETRLRVLGQATGRAQVVMEPRDHQTLLTYQAQIRVEGRFMKLGSQVIEAAAQRAMGYFFERFAEVL